MTTQASHIIEVILDADEHARDARRSHLTALDIIGSRRGEDTPLAKVWAKTAWSAWARRITADDLPLAHARDVFRAALVAGVPADTLQQVSGRPLPRASVQALAAELITAGAHPRTQMVLAVNTNTDSGTRSDLLVHLARNHSAQLKHHRLILTPTQLEQVGEEAVVAYLQYAPLPLRTGARSSILRSTAQADAAARRVLSQQNHTTFPASAALLLAHPGAATSSHLRRRLAHAAHRRLRELEAAAAGAQDRPVLVALRLASRAGRIQDPRDVEDLLVDVDHLQRWARDSAGDPRAIHALLDFAQGSRARTQSVLEAIGAHGTLEVWDSVRPRVHDHLKDMATHQLVPLARTLDRTPAGSTLPGTYGAQTTAGPIRECARDLLVDRARSGDVGAFAAAEELASIGARPAIDDATAARTIGWQVLRRTRMRLLRGQLLAVHEAGGAAAATIALTVEAAHTGLLEELTDAVDAAMTGAATA